MGNTGPNEAAAITVVSPDGSVSVSVVHDFPPPTITLDGYGQAMVQTLRASMPDLTVVEKGDTKLADGTPAYRARFQSTSGDSAEAGEMLVIMRGTGQDQDALIVQASGPREAYTAWAGVVQGIFDTFQASK